MRDSSYPWVGRKQCLKNSGGCFEHPEHPSYLSSSELWCVPCTGHGSYVKITYIAIYSDLGCPSGSMRKLAQVVMGACRIAILAGENYKGMWGNSITSK